MYDWGRYREIHIEKSLQVIDYEGKNKGGKIENFTKLETPYLTVEKIAVGDKFGFLEATVDFALKKPELKDEFSAFLKEKATNIER